MGGSNRVRMELVFSEPFYKLILFQYIELFFEKKYIVTDRLRGIFIYLFSLICTYQETKLYQRF